MITSFPLILPGGINDGSLCGKGRDSLLCALVFPNKRFKWTVRNVMFAKGKQMQILKPGNQSTCRMRIVFWGKWDWGFPLYSDNQCGVVVFTQVKEGVAGGEREREANRWVSDAGIEKRTSTGAFDECFYTHNYTLPHLSSHLKIVKQKGCDSCRATKTKKPTTTHTHLFLFMSHSPSVK